MRAEARMSKKTGGGNDVEKQRVRLQRAGFDKNVIDLMVQAHIEKSGGHLSIKDHILQLGRVWAEDMDVLEKPTMTELMTRTSTVLGSGTELFQSYLVHRTAPPQPAPTAHSDPVCCWCCGCSTASEPRVSL